MIDDSSFFSNNSGLAVQTVSEPELIGRSELGWSELYRVNKAGRFRVYKALKAEYRANPRYEDLLLKEFQIGYSLSHPSICEVYGFGNDPTIGNYIELEWIDGDNLKTVLEKSRPNPELAKKIVIQLCDALSYLHSKQIIHRDIKPSNILLTHNGQNVKIIDFGLSDADSSTISKTPGGTVSFASPELLGGAPVDFRTDIFSLGKVIALLSPKYSGIASKCTRKDPSRRYSDVLQIKSDILSLGRRRLVRLLAAAGSIALIALVSVILSHKPEAVSSPVEETIAEDFIDPSAIDELFLQATDIIITNDEN